MKILHNQSQLKRLLFLGIANVIIGFGSLFTTASQYLVALGGLGLVYIVQYFYTKIRVMVELTPDFIVFNGLFKKKTIHVDEITAYKYFAGDHTLTSKDTTIVIDTNLVDKATQDELKTYFDSLQLK